MADPIVEYDYPSVEIVKYSDKEKDYRGYVIERMEKARDLREHNHDEFDGMTYDEWYESNAKAANSYIPPRKNKKDTRIVTGITNEKVVTMQSALLNLNLDVNISAYDKNNQEIEDLGDNAEALVSKSRQIENPDWDLQKPLIYKELLDQGTVFVEDTIFEWKEVEKKLRGS